MADKAEEALNIYNAKLEAIDKAYNAQKAKVEQMYCKQIIKAQRQYVAFTNAVQADVDKRLRIVDKVIDAESEERRWKQEQEEARLERERSEAAEQKLREQAEAAQRAADEKKKKS